MTPVPPPVAASDFQPCLVAEGTEQQAWGMPAGVPEPERKPPARRVAAEELHAHGRRNLHMHPGLVGGAGQLDRKITAASQGTNSKNRPW